jgi:hypothetical protein
VKAAGGQDAYREQRAQAAEEARSKQTAEEAELEAKRMERKRKHAEGEKPHCAKVKAAGGQDAWKAQLQEQRAQAAEEARSKQTAEEAELEARRMERKRQKAEGNKLRRVKVKAAGGQDAWAQLQEQRAQAAEEARSKQTAEEAELEARRMERKRQKAEGNTLRRVKVKLFSPLEQRKRLLERQQRALAAEQDRAISLSQPKQMVEEATLEAEAFNAVLIESGRPMRARVLLEREKRAQQMKESRAFTHTGFVAVGMFVGWHNFVVVGMFVRLQQFFVVAVAPSQFKAHGQRSPIFIHLGARCHATCCVTYSAVFEPWTRSQSARCRGVWKYSGTRAHRAPARW